MCRGGVRVDHSGVIGPRLQLGPDRFHGRLIGGRTHLRPAAGALAVAGMCYVAAVDWSDDVPDKYVWYLL